MKVVATGLLVAAAVLYVVARSFDADPAAWGYVEAAAEAGMVGALADWFAVTALFRHPLGLPIPHTAIIPRRKDQIGRSLGQFVEGDLLSRELISERLQHAQVGRRVGEWLAQPEHAERAADAIGDGLHAVLAVLDDREVQAGVDGMVQARLASLDVAGLGARAIDVALHGGHHQRLLDAVLTGLQRVLEEHRETLRQVVTKESPWWVPEPIDNRIFAKIHGGAQRFLAELLDSPDHELRRTFEARLATLAERLRQDPALVDAAEELKREVLTHPEVQAWTAGLWQEAKGALMAASQDRTSELHRRTCSMLVRLGERLRDDPELQARVDTGLDRLLLYVVDNYRSEVATLIETTVARWDAPSTSRKLELQVGRDLQFIRINGTVVGALAGVAIHAISEHVL